MCLFLFWQNTLWFILLMCWVVVVVVVWLLNLQLPMQSVPVTNEVEKSNLTQARCTRYNIMWLGQWSATGRWFSSSTPPVSTTNKTDRHDITEILLKVLLFAIFCRCCYGMIYIWTMSIKLYPKYFIWTINCCYIWYCIIIRR